MALARALVKRPHLLLLDEPLSNLDASLRLSMRTEIRRIQRELRVTTILVTHDQIEATTMADRIVVMNAGRIEQVGTAKELYERPHTLFVASFVGSPPINLLDGHADANTLSVREAKLPLAARRRAAWCLASGPKACGSPRPEPRRGSWPPSPWDARCSTRPRLHSGYSASSRRARTPGIARATISRSAFAPQEALLFDRESGRRIDARIAA